MENFPGTAPPSLLSLAGPSPMGLDLRSMTGSEREDKLKRLAIQFEQIMLETLLKSAFPEDREEGGDLMGKSPFNSFRPMLWAQHIADQGGLGLQDHILRRLEEAYQPADDLPTPHASLPDRKQQTLTRRNTSPLNLTRAADTRCPVEAGEISSRFGWRTDPIEGDRRFHSGVDIALPEGSPVRAVMGGTVVFAGWKAGYGNVVDIAHDDGWQTRYAHQSELLVQAGDQVHAGDWIGRSGSTGRSTGPHLHLEMHHNQRPVDPLIFFSDHGIQLSRRKADNLHEG